MVVNLAGEVSYEMFNILVKATNELGKLHIYFSSPEGGLTDVAEAIIDHINKNMNRIEMTFYGENFSAGMLIFLRVNCEKTILADTRGMYHFSWQDITISEGGKPHAGYDTFCMQEMKLSKQRSMEYLKTLTLTDKEMKAIKAGKDVFFPYQRMLELANGTK